MVRFGFSLSGEGNRHVESLRHRNDPCGMIVLEVMVSEVMVSEMIVFRRLENLGTF